MTSAQQHSIDSDYQAVRLAIALLLLIPIGAVALATVIFSVIAVLGHALYEWLLS